MSDQPTYEGFTNNRGSTFQVADDAGGVVELKLTEVSERKVSPRLEQFAIVFQGPRDTFLGQGMRTFNHEEMGTFDLFLVPIRDDAQGFYYEAAFNRFLQEPR